MINVDNKVKNIYYMLCYSFYGEQLKEKNEAELGSEAFDNIYNLFSLLLCLQLYFGMLYINLLYLWYFLFVLHYVQDL